jgi:GAF domain-containing protein
MSGTDTGAHRGRPSSDYRGDRPDKDQLAVLLGALARQLHNEKSVQSTLDGIVHAAVDTIPGAEHAGISEIKRHRVLHTTACTADVVRQIDQAQYDTNEGPSLSSLYEGATVRLSDLRQERRWPTFTRRVAELGIGSMLSFQLYVADDNLGALNLYAHRPGAFTDESEQVGLLFAAHAGVAMSDVQRVTQLTHALGVRDVIGQAKGILMERHRLSGEQAFALLVSTSQRTNTKLVDVARYLIESGELGAPR